MSADKGGKGVAILGRGVFVTCRKGGGLCLVWEGSLSYLQEKGGVGCLIWEGSLSYLQEKGGWAALSGRGAFLTS